MTKGSPNDTSMRLNFEVEVWDDAAKDFRPIYIAPDATSATRGDVYLSDEVDGTETADPKTGGVTAATPAAVKKVYDAAIRNNEPAAQSIQGNLNPNRNNALSLGTSALKWANIYATNINATTFTGDLTGTADKAKVLTPGRNIGIKNGSTLAEVKTLFDGSSDITINLNNLDASTLTTGVIPIERIPKAAQERLFKVPDLATIKKDPSKYDIQQGDSVQDLSTGIMYIIIGDDLKQDSSYLEYTAGTATKAGQLSPGSTIQTNLGSEAAVNFTGASPVTPGVSGTLPVKHGGTGAATLATNGLLVGRGTNAVTTIGATSTGVLVKTTSATDPEFATVLPTSLGGTGNNDGTAPKAAKLSGIYLFDGMQFDGSNSVIHYGTCSSNASTVDKTVTLQTGSNVYLVLSAGALMYIKMTNGNTASNPTLRFPNIPSAAEAKPIKGAGGAAFTNKDSWSAGDIVCFVYDGTGWQIVGSSQPFRGATSSADGGIGLVPAPTSAQNQYFLRGDGTWAQVSTEDTKVTQASDTSATAYPILLKNGTGTGSVTTSVKFNSAVTVTPSTGTITATTFAGNATSASKIGSATVGGTSQPVYIKDGVPTELSGDIGSTAKPVYIKGGVITASNSSLGSKTKPIYMTGGTITASDASVGSKSKPIYMTEGTITASDATIGSTSKAIYMNGGTISECTNLGTVYVGATQPTDSNVKIWIQP